MCVGIPMQLVRCDGQRGLCRDARGEEHWVDLWLVGPQPEGVWLMTFMGAARGLMTAEEAANTTRALDALGALMAGESADLDAAFADLIERGPQLPDFLKGQS